MAESNSTINLNKSKEKLIKQQLNKLKKMYKQHYRKYKYNKNISSTLKVIVNVLNAVTISSLVLSFSGFPILILSICTSSISSILSVINDSVNYSNKSAIYNTSYLQILDLFNNYNNKLLTKNPDHSSILEELNNKIGLILDSSLPISSINSDESIV